MPQAMPTRRVAALQPSSPFFRLPAELRIAVYDNLAFPPLVNDECYGLILSCRQAKQECEDIAIQKFKTWISNFKQDALPQCGFQVRVLLPSLPPIRTALRFGTIREITLVLPAQSVFEPSWPSSSFFGELRHLNPIFGLWLDKLTLHFQGQVRGGNAKLHIQKTFRRLLFILEGGLTYAHDPVGQKREKQVRKFSNVWDHWQPEPSYLKKLVVSWDLTDGIASGDFVHLAGVSKRRPTDACMGRRMYRVVDDAGGLLGDYMLESACRFRPSENERHMLNPPLEHKATCFKCSYTWDYHRHIRGLPENDDERWV
jgi:hypothetical protein